MSVSVWAMIFWMCHQKAKKVKIDKVAHINLEFSVQQREPPAVTRVVEDDACKPHV